MTLRRCLEIIKGYIARPRAFAALIALYAAAGVVLLSYLSGAWHEFVAGPLGRLPRYGHITVAGNLSIALPLGALLFAIVYLVTVDGARRARLSEGTSHESSLRSPVMDATLINLVSFLGITVSSWIMMRLLPDWTMVGEAVIIGLILCCSTFWSLVVPPFEMPIFRKAKPEAKRQALRAQVDFYREMIHLLTWMSIAVFTVVVTYTVFQSIQTLPETKLVLPSTQLLLINHMLLTAYIGLGIFMGLVYQFAILYGKAVLAILET